MSDQAQPADAQPADDKPLAEEFLRARYLPDLSANDTVFTDNPTRIDKPFWKYMVRHGDQQAYDARQRFGVQPDARRWGLEPLFCFQRFGRTETRLPDGRIVFIGGEHEDFYDPDFFIYNDVVVVNRDGNLNKVQQESWADRDNGNLDMDSFPDCEMPDEEFWEWSEKQDEREELAENLRTAASARAGTSPADIEIYCYPLDVFPGTDFHTATYVKDESGDGSKEYIYIIGGLGYHDSPHRTTTLTHRLDLQDYSIRRMDTCGDTPPGPKAGGDKEGKAELQGNRIMYTVGSTEYVLSLGEMRWSRVDSENEAS